MPFPLLKLHEFEHRFVFSTIVGRDVFAPALLDVFNALDAKTVELGFVSLYFALNFGAILLLVAVVTDRSDGV